MATPLLGASSHPADTEASEPPPKSLLRVRVQPLAPQIQRAGKPTLGRESRLVQPVIQAPPSAVERPAVVQQVKAEQPAVRRNPVPTARASAPEKPPPAPAKPAPVQRRSVPAKKPRADRTPQQDLEEVARGLLDPLLRLMRAELRHGRERAGRRNDHRR
ncbi:hypothetical protein JOD54_005054 [Actinokineospora baliensis]|uniref:hypothetical protein n=1 Tax=Actinokineospora baliensis TaxID=547056 RepID=UPI00195BA0F1|nr:hypothetical protein [Actinokineospora baliensis]MBM7774850.1 hypothetical protein [Actinokineospora baliensis]